jgi:hypothetical protein
VTPAAVTVSPERIDDVRRDGFVVIPHSEE